MHEILRSEVFAEQLPVAAERIRLRADVASHGHAFFEIAVVLAGRATHVSTGGEAVLRRGSVVVLRPGEWHGYSRCRDLVLHNTYVGADVFTRELAWIAGDPQLGRIFQPPHRHPSDRLTVQLAESTVRQVDGWCTALAEDPHPASRLGHLTLLAGALAAGEQPLHRPDPAHPAVQQAMRMLEATIDRPWTLTELAAEVSLAPGYLVRLFGRSVGVSPMAYLQRIRAERAAALLIETDLPVATIGAMVGWPDPSHASRRFRACFAMSPLQYRSAFRPAPG